MRLDRACLRWLGRRCGQSVRDGEGGLSVERPAASEAVVELAEEPVEEVALGLRT
ncbi:hypothetical protein K353_04299 [Kitasatospora sp. SolWspMP-SS2h]|uniref:hypothetical protein n=1 Tax=Kitasatospora sp. SolWspMP-SS2h TaxID=1305729 RepID=UPI000DBF7F6C|nr:hypothetical protein [Kitasatospora sp. SolWspMP-SS2h]RAJ38362.1 hypothetical protein K353_04299 [Kitasatospora sp. SolWspMP-SS2h]